MRVTRATPDLVPSLLARMGPKRVASLARRVGDPAAEITSNIARSTLTWAGVDGLGAVVLGGAIPQDDGAYVWQFITPAVRQHKRAYLRMSRDMVEQGLARFRLLVAMIETTYTAALRHCRRNGFEIMPAQVVDGVLVHLCVLRRAHV